VPALAARGRGVAGPEAAGSAESPAALRQCAPVTTFPVPDALALSGHGRRLAAALLDVVAYCFVIGACGVGGFLVGLAGAGTSDGSDSDGWEELGWIVFGTLVGVAVGVVAGIVLAIFFMQRRGAHNGQTLGKQVVGIRVARTDHREVGLGLTLLREVAAKWLLICVVASLVSAALGFADLGSIGLPIAIAIWYLPAFFDDERRALHDRMSSTRVVVASAPPPPVPAGDDLWPAAAP